MLLLYDADVHLGKGWNDTLGTGGLGIIKSVEQIEEIELELTFNFIVGAGDPRASVSHYGRAGGTGLVPVSA